ncbi:hypothetical protein [Pseudoroseomonas cervicalis]|uniref:hypothetical protein n=1 Tax=Teichococcus cervicalis TaxID=204525 RepID=UPI0022F1AE12|nr:hypothetical protein [Pseudoroseomonas cervicalis]WBV45464.1 hypothetical protein PFY06_21535 [Pseudoroseomonas cervicalis]
MTPLPAPLPGTPFGQAVRLDLGTPGGMAMLRQFDARLRRMGEAAQQAAVRALACELPLAERVSGLLVLPGGALALRQGTRVLVAEAASALAVQGAALDALRRRLPHLPGLASVVHGPDGLCHRPGLPAAAAAQAMTLLPQAAALAPLLPAALGWDGPAMLRWCPGGAVAWRMAPAPPELALGASVAGEALPPDGPLPAEAWDLPQGDDRFPLFSSGLFAHLDELLGNEVSDRLRYALIACWTDGADSLASRLADAAGLLPAGFATPWDRPAGLDALARWPRAAALAQGWPGAGHCCSASPRRIGARLGGRCGATACCAPRGRCWRPTRRRCWSLRMRAAALMRCACSAPTGRCAAAAAMWRCWPGWPRWRRAGRPRRCGWPAAWRARRRPRCGCWCPAGACRSFACPARRPGRSGRAMPPGMAAERRGEAQSRRKTSCEKSEAARKMRPERRRGTGA